MFVEYHFLVFLKVKYLRHWWFWWLLNDEVDCWWTARTNATARSCDLPGAAAFGVFVCKVFFAPNLCASTAFFSFCSFNCLRPAGSRTATDPRARTTGQFVADMNERTRYRITVIWMKCHEPLSLNKTTYIMSEVHQVMLECHRHQGAYLPTRNQLETSPNLP